MPSLRRLARMSGDEVRVRTRQYLLARLERWGASAPPRDPAQFALQRGSLAGRTFEPLSAGTDASRDIARQVALLDPGSIDALRRGTRLLHEGSVGILGFPTLEIGDPPRWHREARGGEQAPRRHWSRIAYLDPKVVGDHKVLWEVNRCQYLLAPAIVWLTDGRDEDFRLIERHLLSWLDENPFRQGVNWASSLEVAYRGIAWCWLLWLLSRAPWTPAARRRLAVSLERHALHIERYLSHYFSPNTHLTGEALGLFYIGTALAESRHARRWRELGSNILESWLPRQVHEDGVYFEQATQYQRYTAEIYLQYLLLARATGHPVGTRVEARLHGLFDVLHGIANAAGSMPLIGDDDGGLLLPLDACSPEDLRGLMLLGAVALDRPELRLQGSVDCAAMSCWLCGPERTRRMLVAASKFPAWRARWFPEGGLAVLRDGWGAEAAVAVMDAGPHGAMNCAHAHADALSMTLDLGVQPLFVDRGTLTYVGAERNEFRSTCSHNTLEIDGLSSVEPTSAFQWRSIPARANGSLLEVGPVQVFRGCSRGHQDTAAPSTHIRNVVHVHGGSWLVYDVAERPGARSGLVRWQLAPELEVSNTDARSVCVHHPSQGPLALVSALAGGPLQVRSRATSPRYGATVPAALIEMATDDALRALTLIVPASGLEVAPPVLELNCDAGRHWSWKDGVTCWNAAIAAPGDDHLDCAGWRSDAALLIAIHAVTGAGQDADPLIGVVALEGTWLQRGSSVEERHTRRTGKGCIIASQQSGTWSYVESPAMTEANA